MYIRVSQIAGVYRNNIFESYTCTLFHIMPFAKIISSIEKKE